ncbi:ABC transporter substrate-binding protein [Nocardioides sp. GY 10127]|uniref:ABC transporter substrate-binding protein n=1 Tax=Nocardioides sp. GY 10127 TaxID=2569762 RepID=UPI0010A8249B|nr:ABC transporter substrate-binding protein [Nocardioides sp. GY 10127]TIC86398.1 ABC transporter substrate-binding protein [Nocardioides sp. GY 10127]
MTAPTFTRRALPALVALALSAPALTACGAMSSGETSSAASGSAASGPWSYTDDTGTTIDLDAQPTRVVAFADQALALLSYGITPVAIFGRTQVKTDPRFADYDLSGVEILGNTYGEIDLEKLAAAAPDIVVTGIYPSDRKGTLDTDGPYYGFSGVSQQKQVEKIAPVAAIEIGGKGIDVVESTTSLALALGADEDEVAEDKKSFEAAAADLRSATEANPGIEVTMMYADADGVYVVKTADEPESQLYSTYGVDYTDLHPKGAYYWDIYSWENAAEMMTGDVILANVEGYQADDLADQPTFADDPALVAGQVYSWNGAAMDYASQATQMTTLAKIISEAKDVV